MTTRNIKPRRGVFDSVRDNDRMLRNKKPIGFEGFEEFKEFEEKKLEDSVTASVDSSFTDKSESPSPKQKTNVEYIPECATYEDPVESRFQKCRIAGILILIFAVLFPFTYSNGKSDEIDPQLSNEETLKQNIMNLQKKFPTQDTNVWPNFFSGIKSIVTDEPKKPSVFLLLYINDVRTSECLAREIASKAVKFLNQNSLEPIFIRGEEIKQNASLVNDKGLFITAYKTDIEERHVMVVLGLQDIPAVVAQSFHFLCDTYNPTVKEAVYMFTLKVDERFLSDKPTRVAEEVLESLWNESLDSDILSPLKTRIADTVLFVQSEQVFPCSH